MQRIVKYPGARITSPYGTRIHPITKQRTDHNGVDVAAPQGTAVTAPYPGKAAQIYTHSTGGLTLIFDCDNGTQLRMCHLQSVSLAVGERRAAGQRIATVGGSPDDAPCAGSSTGAHLHIGVVKGGARIDPLTEFPCPLK